jgi:phosphohistidine phosphatase
MIIYFVRHASAGTKKLSGKKDEKRPLDDEGVQQSTSAGRILSSLDAAVDAVISSPLKRALQTASLIANEIGYDGKVSVENALRPEAKYDHFREMLRKYAKAEAVMVVGHNPNFSEFLGRLVAETRALAFIDLKKGSVAKVESEHKRYVLHWVLTPRLAKAAADASVLPSSTNGTRTDNGASLEFVIPAEYTRKRKGKKAKKKKVQAEALTIKLRPKTSRK